MENARFTKNDNGFVCENCGREVPPLGYTSRNHCPFCLCSKHLDINPGDRASDCKGLLQPVAVCYTSKKGYVITYKCARCGEVRHNRAQSDDDKELLIFLTNHYNQ